MTDYTKDLQLTDLIKKPELWIGLVTVVLVVYAGGMILVNKFKGSSTEVSKIDVNSAAAQAEAGNTATTSGDITNQAASTSVSPTTVPVSQAPVKNTKVTKLADTSGLYTVVADDTFWSISVNACGEGVYAESIKAQNGYRSDRLTPGSTLSVSCK